MSRELHFQDPGEGIHEAEVVEVMVAEGDRVEDGDSVLAVETDKATTEVPSPYAGEVERIAVQVGDRIAVGDLLMSFAGEGGGDAAESPPAAEQADDASQRRESREQTAHRQAEEAGGGRRDELPVPAAPSTRRLARELDVDLRRVEPSGPGGRVLAEDVRAAAEGAGAAPQERETEAERPLETAGELPDFTRWGEIERVPLRSVRRATAQATARAWREIPHVMHHDLVDITALERFRREQAPQVKERGGRLTLTVLAMKAAVAALRAFPRFNASLDGERGEIVLKRHYHFGVAVETERGLLVPVVRDVDRKSVSELAVELTELTERTRNGEAGREELEGGTFTLTNVGSLGGTLFTPIIHYPEAAILGIARAAWQPVVEDGGDDGRIVTRLRLPLCLAFDHRLADGAEAARFVNHLASSLRDPETFLLAV